jgi:hypothetical protein
MSAGTATDTGSMYMLCSEFCIWPVSHFILCFVTHIWCVGLYNAVHCAECRDFACHMLLSHVHRMLIILPALDILCVTGF